MEGKRGEPRKETMWSSGPHWKGEIWADLNEARESAVNIWGKSFPDQGLDRAEALSEAGSVPGVWIKNWWARVRRKGVCCKDSDLSLIIGVVRIRWGMQPPGQGLAHSEFNFFPNCKRLFKHKVMMTMTMTMVMVIREERSKCQTGKKERSLHRI